MADLLKHKYATLWAKSTDHTLTHELSLGTLPLPQLRLYLSQDFSFFEIFIKLLARCISLGPNMEDNVRLGKQLGFICADENNYFVDSIKELDSKLGTGTKHTSTLASVAAYNDYMAELIASPETTYEEIVTVLYVMEQVYLEWADRGAAISPPDLSWLYKDWIDLHRGPDFEGWCIFLKSLVDVSFANEIHRDRMESAFASTLQYEFNFFQDCYNLGEI